LSEGAFQLLAERSPERSGSVNGAESGLTEAIEGRRGHLQKHVSLGHSLAKEANLDIGDTPERLFDQGMEHHHLVHAVAELRTEILSNDLHEGSFHIPFLSPSGHISWEMRYLGETRR